jgi:hypothetical protein
MNEIKVRESPDLHFIHFSIKRWLILKDSLTPKTVRNIVFTDGANTSLNVKVQQADKMKLGRN